MLIDCHQHIGSLSTFRRDTATAAVDVFGVKDTTPGPQRLHREANRELGITHCVVQPDFEYPTVHGSVGVTAINDELAAYAKAQGFVVAAFGIVDPLAMGDPRAEANRVLSELGLAGITWHTRFQRVPTDSPLVKEVIDACPSAKRHVIAVHCFADSKMEAPWRLEVLLETFPQRVFLAQASLTAASQWEEMIQMCRRCSNLYLDTAGMSPVGLWIERLVAVIGADRLLFGTDLYVDPPIFRHNYALQAIEAARISDRDRELIVSQNALDLFGLRQ